LTQEDAQAIFIDTPGIHQPRHMMGEYMVRVATDALQDADIIVFVTDSSSRVTDEDQNVANIINEAGQDLKVIRVLNKVDLANNPDHYKENVDAQLALVPYTEWVTTVATNHKGVDELLELLLSHLPEGPRFYPPDQVSDLWTRDIASEMIREAALHLTDQEVPHSIAVVIEEFKERKNGMIYIAANLFVERDSQKAIIVGKGGSMIKRISSNAREEIERFMETKIFLDLRVKVMKNWRSDDNALRRLGYNINR
jgi:GTP-binding protein Era